MKIRKVLPRQVLPTAIERDYTRALLKHTREIRAALMPVVDALPGIMKSANAERRDAGETDVLRAFMAAARARITKLARPVAIERLVKSFAKRTADHNKTQLDRTFRAAFGRDVLIVRAQVSRRRISRDRADIGVDPFDPNLLSIIEGFIAENVALITNIGVQTANDIEGVAMRAITRGTNRRDVAKDLAEKFGFSRNRARLVARDQTGKLYGQINATRQKSIGVKRFIWRTVSDRRVRGTPGGAFPNATPSHYARDGEVFAYSDPRFKSSGDGIPGVPIQCRCYAEPVLDDLF